MYCLLDAEPHHQDTETHDYIISQKTEQFQDLKQAVQTVYTAGNQTKLVSSSENLVYMYGIEKGRLADIKRDPVLRKDLLTIAKPFLDWFENEMDAYYCFTGFTVIVDNIKDHHINALVSDSAILIQRSSESCCSTLYFRLQN